MKDCDRIVWIWRWFIASNTLWIVTHKLPDRFKSETHLMFYKITPISSATDKHNQGKQHKSWQHESYSCTMTPMLQFLSVILMWKSWHNYSHLKFLLQNVLKFLAFFLKFRQKPNSLRGCNFFISWMESSGSRKKKLSKILFMSTSMD